MANEPSRSVLVPIRSTGSLVNPLAWASVGGRMLAVTLRYATDRIEAAIGQPHVVTMPADPGPGGAAELSTRMRRLLDRNLGDSRESSYSSLLDRIVDQLVPDEAAMVNTLADGEPAVCLTVRPRAGIGRVAKPAIENAALVGRQAGVSLPHLTPRYVSHLLLLGVVEIGPELPALKDDYQILAADTDVMRAVRNSRYAFRPALIERRTIRLTELGKDLAALARGGDPL